MTSIDPDTPVAPDGGPHRDEDLAGMVDAIEQRVIRERRDERIPGNIDDRDDAEPVVSDDDAPD